MKKLLLLILLLGYASQSCALFDLKNWSSEAKMTAFSATSFLVSGALATYANKHLKNPSTSSSNTGKQFDWKKIEIFGKATSVVFAVGALGYGYCAYARKTVM